MTENINNYSAKNDSLFKKIMILWAIIYVLLFMSTSQFIPDIPPMQKWVIWFGKKLLHLPTLEKIQMTGSGDTTYDYVFTLLVLIISAVLAIVISIADRKRKNYQQLYLFTIVLARYYVVYTMFAYGFAKVFEGQFPPLAYFSLEEKFGDMSPMGVLWTFMESSPAYTFFGGLMEIIGGVLLLFRRTKTFGALFSLTVMINVAILNFTYDVPVKIFSTHLVLLCIFILSYEWEKLYNFFILHKAEILNYNKLRVRKKWMLISLRAVKFLLIAYLFYAFLIGPLMNSSKEKVFMEGVYSTQLFIKNNDTIPPNPEDSTSWKKLYISYNEGVNVITKENTYSWYNSKIDSLQKTIGFYKNDDSTNLFATFRYNLKSDTLFLKGRIKTDSVEMTLSRKTRKDYPVLNRGYHWVNEYPYNR